MQDFSITGLLDRIGEQKPFRDLLADMARGTPGRAIGSLGLPEPVRPAVVAAVARLLRRPLLWILPEADDARAAAEAVRAYVSRPERVHLFPAPDALPYERVPWDPASRELRLTALAALHEWAHTEGAVHAPLLVASVRGAMVRTLSPDDLAADTGLVRVGHELGVWDLLERLQRLGYESVAQVTEAGQMAHRGGIVDAFPPGERAPVRIEWFGDEVYSIRGFDPSTQRSQGEVECVLIRPASEALPRQGPQAAAALARIDATRLHPLAESELHRHREYLAQGKSFPGIEFYGPLLHPEKCTVIDHMPEGSWVVSDNPDWLGVVAQGVQGQAETLRREQVEAGELAEDWPGEPLADWSEVVDGMARHRHLVVGHHGADDLDGGLASLFSAPPRFAGRVEDAVVEAAAMADAGRAVVVVTRQAQRVAELLVDVGIQIEPLRDLPVAPDRSGIAVVHGALAAGWQLDEPRRQTVLLTDGELFGWRMPRSRRAVRRPDVARAADYFAEYTPGDYIVHIEHGIGLFRGISRLQMNGTERDYLCIEYAQGDMLYVPTHQADRVSRYVGTGDVTPSVTRLGSADWERAKARARREVEDIARRLLELYARREVARRDAFLPDTTWQAEMEAAFPYVETEDQLRAIEDVKRDMESSRPMDRLVVGDVGFGKTEVAIRAAFKAVMAGRQVAVLAPTTVLAQQHFETFRMRLAAFPVRVEMLSRFRRQRDQEEIARRLADGDVDIVVGTHRLLSADIQFRSLGLLVVDEEHRFGVKDKERLREIRHEVDTLTLTATPIPRTMHLALSGLRDLTTISTPPEERLPVVTHVGPYDEALVRQAIRRELQRRGQVFYVHNRVEGIELVAATVGDLVPEARVGVAHGQMREDALAQAMLEFVGGGVDVLVCTSIIESGLDIPNANTLIVDRADRFGLAQLHQLRGRVGRGAQRAYAYLLHPPGYRLNQEAVERLEALAESSDLGSGFRLAMHDLEIRGAGEILGARQHGQVAAIGLDLYTRLLAEAIKKLRADAPGPTREMVMEISAVDPNGLPTVDLPLDAFLPEEYVPDTAERTRLYRRMAAAGTHESVGEIAGELVDRFGRPPTEVTNLLALLELRVLARLAGAQSVQREGGAVAIHWPPGHVIDRASLKSRLDPRARIGRHQISLPASGPNVEWLPELRRALEIAAETERPTD